MLYAAGPDTAIHYIHESKLNLSPLSFQILQEDKT